MRKGWMILGGLVLFLAVGGYHAGKLYSQGCTRSVTCGRGVAMLGGFLQLTPAQQRKVAAIDAQYAQRRPQLRENVWNARDELAAVLRDPEVTEKEAVAALRKLSDAREEMAVDTIRYLLEVRRHLDKEQQAKLAEVVDCGMCGVAGTGGMGRGSGRGGNGRGQGSGGCGLGPCPGP